MSHQQKSNLVQPMPERQSVPASVAADIEARLEAARRKPSATREAPTLPPVILDV